MLHPFLRSVAVSVCLVPALVLTGCSANFSMPDATPAAQGASLGAIQGNNYGGHAPLVGAHVFLLQAGTSGYNGASTSLLGANETGGPDFYGSSYPTTKDTTAGSPTNGFYYVTTDSHGDFDLTGTGYTCTPGLPVYAYAQGGNPETVPAVTLTSVNSVPGTGIYAGGTLTTFQNSGTNLIYQGEQIEFAGITGVYAGFNYAVNGNVTYTVVAGTPAQALPASQVLTTSQFTVYIAGSVFTANEIFGAGVTASQYTPIVSNPAVVNLAVLGICPSNGTANFNTLPFIYMNEVSTAAAAYALGGFFPAPGTPGLTKAGAVGANLSIPASNPQALLGLQNAALTAEQLYDIAGGNISCSGAGCDGETHIARTATPGVPVLATTTAGSATVAVATTVGLQVGITITGSTLPAGETIAAIGANSITLSTGTGVTAGANIKLYAGAGNGTVPQSLLSTVGNILANCVDSANTYDPYAGTGTASTQCSTLFADTLSAGTSGTAPVDTASSAVDIAHNPWANVAALVTLPTGNVPFQPYLSTANDFSVGITYTPAHVGSPQGIAVDGSGQVWYTNFSTGYLSALTPLGAVLYNYQAGSGDNLGYVTIDPLGAAWFGDITAQDMEKVNAAGAYIGAYGNNIDFPYGIAADGNGHIYIENLSPQSVNEFTNAGMLTTNPANPLAGASNCNTLNGGNWHADHVAISNLTGGDYYVWYTSELGDFVCIVNATTGALVHQVLVNAAQGLPGTYSPEFIGIDANGTGWFPDQFHAGMNKVTQGGVLTNPTGGTLSGAFGSAVDGAGNIFVTNRTGNDITEYLGATSAAVSATNFLGGGNATVMSDPLNVSMDPSGNLWVANYTGSRIVELVGIGAPTYMPLSVAASVDKLGSKP